MKASTNTVVYSCVIVWYLCLWRGNNCFCCMYVTFQVITILSQELFNVYKVKAPQFELEHRKHIFKHKHQTLLSRLCSRVRLSSEKIYSSIKYHLIHLGLSKIFSWFKWESVRTEKEQGWVDIGTRARLEWATKLWVRSGSPWIGKRQMLLLRAPFPSHTLACSLYPNVTQCSVPGREGGDVANERVIVLLRCREDC